jgi:crotonobetainyl-CoA:carnitine CoA-transferase CaiB-like acyl-CoA transferase
LADDPRFGSNKHRVEHRRDMDIEIDRVFTLLTSADVVARLDAAQIANARLNSVAGFIDHPQLSGRDAWREVGSPVGPLRALVPPVRMDNVNPVMDPIPALGEHTDAILRELAFDEETIEEWHRGGVV